MLVGLNPATIKHPPDSKWDRFYRESEETLVAAGVLDLTAVAPDASDSDTTVAVYVSNANTEWLPAILPVSPGTKSVLLPDGSSAMVLHLRNGKPVAISEAVTITHGQRQRAQFRPTNPARGTVLISIEFPAEARQEGTVWERLPAPKLTLRSGERTILPSSKPRGGFGNDGALFAFRDVPPGPWSVTMESPLWRASPLRGEMPPSGSLVTVDRPMIATPAAQIIVRWNESGPAGLPAELCGKPSGEENSRDALLLLSCSGLQPGQPPDTIDESSCRVAARAQEIDLTRSAGRFERVTPGLYVVRFASSGGVPQLAIVNVEAGESKEVSFSDASFDVYGRVTLNGAPIRARLEFASGAAMSDDTGTYYARLAATPRDLPIAVRSCEGELLYTSIPANPLVPGQRFDIEIRTNRLSVDVVDAKTGSGIEAASVQVGVVRDGEAGLFLEGIEPADAEGRVVVKNLPDRQAIVVCALAKHYARRCNEPIHISSDRADYSAKISLRRDVFTGRIRLPRPVQWAHLYFVTPLGQVSEQVRVEAAGEFSFRLSHSAPEYVVLVSDLPLAAMPLPPNFTADTIITFPDAPVRTISVRVAPSRVEADALVGLFVGGLYIPADAFARHQGSRGLQSDVYGRELMVKDVLASGPVAVMLGPDPVRLPPQLPPGVDLFTLPEFTRSLPRQVVGPTRLVIFE